MDGNGVVDQNDVVAAEAAVFGARPVFAGGPYSGRQPQPHFNTGSLPCGTCHGIPFVRTLGRRRSVSLLPSPP